MKIQTTQTPRQAQIYWLSLRSAQDEAIMAFLKNDFAIQKDQNILPVIVESGEGELAEQLRLLMKRNQDELRLGKTA